MSLRPKCHKKVKWHLNWNVNKIDCIQIYNLINMEMSPQLKFPQTEMTNKLIYHQNWNVIKIEMSPNLNFKKLKYHLYWNVTKNYDTKTDT